MWKDVPRQAATVLHIVRGTRVGPILRTPRLRAMSADSTMLAEEPPPEPAIRPVRTLETWPGSSPLCSMAWRIAIAA